MAKFLYDFFFTFRVKNDEEILGEWNWFCANFYLVSLGTYSDFDFF
jgi:hypothetical protein